MTLTEEQAWEVVDYNEDLVKAVVDRWTKKHGYPFDEWINTGYIGAFNGVMGYNPGAAKLSTYMYRCITNALNSGWIKETKGIYQTSRGKDESSRIYTQRAFLSHPTVDQADLDADYFEYALTEEFEEELVDLLDTNAEYDAIKPHLFRLAEEEQDIIYCHLWKDMSFEAIGQKLGVSRQRVHQRYKAAIEQVREMVGA